MTHDELLAEIDIQLLHLPSYFKDGDKAIAGMKALRAVVELHKPQGNFGDTYIDGKPTHPYCPECIDPDVYPCSTIQAIEKELM